MWWWFDIKIKSINAIRTTYKQRANKTKYRQRSKAWRVVTICLAMIITGSHHRLQREPIECDMHALAHHCYPCESTLLWRWPRSLQALQLWLCCLHRGENENYELDKIDSEEYPCKTITSMYVAMVIHIKRQQCNPMYMQQKQRKT